MGKRWDPNKPKRGPGRKTKKQAPPDPLPGTFARFHVKLKENPSTKPYISLFHSFCFSLSDSPSFSSSIFLPSFLQTKMYPPKSPSGQSSACELSFLLLLSHLFAFRVHSHIERIARKLQHKDQSAGAKSTPTSKGLKKADLWVSR